MVNYRKALLIVGLLVPFCLSGCNNVNSTFQGFVTAIKNKDFEVYKSYLSGKALEGFGNEQSVELMAKTVETYSLDDPKAFKFEKTLTSKEREGIRKFSCTLRAMTRLETTNYYTFTISDLDDRSTIEGEMRCDLSYRESQIQISEDKGSRTCYRFKSEKCFFTDFAN